MSAPNWEEIDVPRGQYIGWGNVPGQEVTGKVLSYGMNAGTDVNGNACPQLGLQLIEPCISYRDRGATREEVAAGEIVVINAGLVSLKRAIIAAQPEAGDLIKLSFTNLVKADKGDVKEFAVKIARGAGKSVPTARPSAPQQAPQQGYGQAYNGQAQAPQQQQGYAPQMPQQPAGAEVPF